MGGQYSPITKAFNWTRGEDREWAFDVGAGEDADEYVDTVLWTLEFVMRVHPDDAASVLTKTSGAGQIVRTAGTLAPVVLDIWTVSTTDDDSLALLLPVYHYSLRRTNAGAEAEIAFGEANLRWGAGR